MYTGNDLNIGYWYINRWSVSSSLLSVIHDGGRTLDQNPTFNGNSVRPVVTLKFNVKIKSGAGTMTKPYSLYM